ncbi:hypothetical protein HAX54_026267 [Datura stramonium]|uniref:Uncharacterized protein n=1 Tax=Datura stramonium TaxID=4076 RepID=A0ABS8V3W9_DATST|nr:hypothetical protein [Datura stramonium]
MDRTWTVVGVGGSPRVHLRSLGKRIKLALANSQIQKFSIIPRISELDRIPLSRIRSGGSQYFSLGAGLTHGVSLQQANLSAAMESVALSGLGGREVGR